MTRRRLPLVGLLLLAGVLFPSAAGGEGTPVENAHEWLSLSGHGAYLDVLHAHQDGGGG